MDDVSPAQCRGARALLRWTQADLAAKSGVAKRTVNSFEGDVRPLARRTRRAVAEALKKAGIVFDPDGGIRRGAPERAVAQSLAHGDRKDDVGMCRDENDLELASDLLDRARRWRMRAEEYRTVSETVETPLAKETYARLARTYEEVARQTEERAQGLRREQQADPKRQAG